MGGGGGGCKVYARQWTWSNALLRYVMFGYFGPHTLLNIFEKTEKVSLVNHLNEGFHEDGLTIDRLC